MCEGFTHLRRGTDLPGRRMSDVQWLLGERGLCADMPKIDAIDYFALAVGDPENDRDFLIERSPKTHIADIASPLLVIQGQNDPRVVERESRDVVEQLRGLGRDVDYLVFEDEGHDVLKLANRVRCYDTIVGFFAQHLS